jgi:hypothetical protein
VYYVFVLLGLVPYFIVQLLVRKQAVVEFGLCRRHHRSRVAAIALGWVGALGSVLLFPFVLEVNVAAALAVLSGLLVWPALGVVLSTVVRARRIDREQAWLQLDQRFLNSVRAP